MNETQSTSHKKSEKVEQAMTEETSNTATARAEISHQANQVDEAHETREVSSVSVGLPAVESWLKDYKARHGLTPVEDVNKLESRLDLTHAHPSGIAQLFASGHAHLNSLFRDNAMLRAGQRQLTRVLDEQIARETSDGASVLSMCVGIATWPGNNHVPLLLYPIRVIRDEEADNLARCEIRFAGRAQLNESFVRIMRDKGVNIDIDELMDTTEYEGVMPETSTLFARIREQVGGTLIDFSIEREIIIGNFVHSSTLITRDAQAVVERMENGLTGNLLLDAMKGDTSSIKVIASQNIPAQSVFDGDPHDELEIGDVDNTTRYAAHLAANGTSVLLDIPSAGDSVEQSAAVASRAVMSGKTVLYVAGSSEQKRSFMRELKNSDIDGLALDLTSPEMKKSIDRQLINAVGFQPGTAVSHFDQLADELVGVRARLTRYLGDLHGKNEQWGVSAYETINNLARISALPSHPSTHVRLNVDVARALAGHEQEWSEKLVRAGLVGEYSIGPSDTAWYKASLYTEDEAVDAYQRVVRLLENTLPATRNHISETVKTCGFPIPTHAQEWGKEVLVLKNLRRVLDVFQPTIFERDIASMIEATKSKAQRKADGSTMGFWERRRHIKEAKSLLRVGAHVDNLHEALIVVSKQSDQWHTFVPRGGWPVLPNKLDEIVENQESLESDLTALSAVLAPTPEGGELTAVEFAQLERRLKRLFDDHRSLDTLPERTTLEREFANAGLSGLTEDLRNRGIEPEAAPDELRLAWWTTVFESIVHSSPIISNQDGSVLSAATERFNQVDTEHVRSVGSMINQEMMKRLSEMLFADSQEANELHAELASSSSLSLSLLHKRYPAFISAAKPIMASTTAALASTYPVEHVADIAIIDACAHVHPAELLGIIARVNTVVVIAHKETISSAGLQSLLPFLLPLRALERPSRRDPRLAQFLRENGYGNMPIALSTANKRGSVEFHRVAATGVPSTVSGIVETNKQEIEAVADLIEERAHSFTIVPAAYRLTVICLTDAHRLRIGAELKSRSLRDDTSAKFMRHARVITINDVGAADSNDVIITMGFAKTSHGRLIQQFGALETPGAHGMLLDALAMGHNRVDIVSSFSSADMDDERLHQSGPQLLKKLLFACEHITDDFPEPQEHSEGAEILLTDLAQRIRQRGLTVAVNYGYDDGEQIPLVVGLPNRPYALAICTDDAQFMSITSTRQRHRYTVENLERLGWSVMHVWSVAAFVNPDKEVDRIVAYLARVYGETL